MGLRDDIIALSQAFEEISAPLIESQIATLRELWGRYETGCTFPPGEIVTPRSGGTYTDAGVPHVVLEVRRTPLLSGERDPGSPLFGMRIDMRVACRTRRAGKIAAFWVESWAFERFEDFAARSAAEAEKRAEQKPEEPVPAADTTMPEPA